MDITPGPEANSMRTWRKAILAVILTSMVAIGGYVAFLAATYVDETATSGTAYGFSIGSSKGQALAAVLRQQDKHPSVATYVKYGRRAGDNFTLSSSEMNLGTLGQHDRWDVLLDGPGEFSNSVRLTFHDDRLVEIHRHRQYFELP